MDLSNIDDISDIEELNDNDLFELLDQIDYNEEKTKIEELEDDSRIMKNQCSNCNSKDSIIEDYSAGILVCTKCGSINDNIMDKNPEWRNYEDDTRKTTSRCSVPTSFFLPQSSLGTTISGYKNSNIKRLHSWSRMPYRERSLHIVLKKIQELCRKAGIIKYIEDDAKILYKNISECKHTSGKNKGKYIIIRGKNRESLIAACVFYACKRRGKTRSPKEIATLFGLKYTEITKGCKTFLKLMKVKKMSYDYNSSIPIHFIPRFCKSLNIKKEFIEQAIQIVRNIQKLNIGSVHTPLSVATGAILLMADINKLPITKKMIAKEFDVSEVTITKAYKKLYRYRNILINDELTEILVEKLEEEKKKAKLPQKLIEKYKSLTISVTVDDAKKSNTDIIELEDVEAEPNEYAVFDMKNNSLDSYIQEINCDIYGNLAATESEYNEFIKTVDAVGF